MHILYKLMWNSNSNILAMQIYDKLLDCDLSLETVSGFRTTV